ncbi:hypothetical protein [Rhodococcus sp. ACT016]|uniref:hypothetical protein n=1 Tax=Rhodococcus sp. ACT016 TaxID=3134808 RepID=UPI003D29C372
MAGRYQHDWVLFTDWCTATDQPPLPAAPGTLAQFLHEHPAAAATQRRRVSTINTIHRKHRLPPPGRSETVRRHLDAGRTARMDHLATTLQHRAEDLPVAEWPAGLFGRRDALLLVLAATGMTFTQITRLRRGDLTTDPDETLVAAIDGQQFRLAPSPGTAPDHTSAAVQRRWAEVLSFLDHYPNTRMLESHLTGSQMSSVPELTERQAAEPLLPPIDRWGHLPLPAQAMTPQSVAFLTRAHLTGIPPIHRPLRLQEPSHTRSDPPSVSVLLDPNYYERGTDARLRAQESLKDVLDILDDVEDRADVLLNDLLALLDGI